MKTKRTLKYTILFGLLTLFISCNNDELENKITELEKDKLGASHSLNEKEEVILALVNSINEIEDNLSKIKEQENIITTEFNKGNVELSTSSKDQIIDDIHLINQLLKDNKAKIAALNQKLQQSEKDANTTIAALEKMVESLANRIQEKDAEISNLQLKLAEANQQLKVLFEEYNYRLTELSEQEEQLNTAYYCYGSSKELKEKGVITKEGGIIGIGKTSKLADNFNKDYFTKVDISLFNEIKLLSKKAKIVTNHPSKSYELSPDKLIIKDSEMFWESSKYLVIIVE